MPRVMVNGKRVDIPRYSPEDYPRFSPYNAISIRGIHVGVDCLEFEMPDRPAAKNTGFVKLEATVTYSTNPAEAEVEQFNANDNLPKGEEDNAESNG